MSLNELPIEFHIDTGADVTVTTEKLYRTLKAPQLQKCSKSLVGPSKEALNVQGQFKGTLTHGNNSAEQDIYIIKGLLCKPLIGRPAITALQLVSRGSIIDSVKQQIMNQHPELLQGLGTIEEKYNRLMSNHMPLPLPDGYPFHSSPVWSKN